MNVSRPIELLAPAKTADIGIEAVLHGADAVYIGGPCFGARAAAANSVNDIARLVDFAHRYEARVYVTLNTLLYDDDLKPAERLIAELYRVGVDALIVQDMGVLRLDIPPIALHASTQTDNRTVEKCVSFTMRGFRVSCWPGNCRVSRYVPLPRWCRWSWKFCAWSFVCQL